MLIENGALTISSLTLSDGGMYQCVAENKHGIVYASAELKVLGKRRSVPFSPRRLIRNHPESRLPLSLSRSLDSDSGAVWKVNTCV